MSLVTAGHVPSLAAIAGDALVVPGKIAHQQVDSATVEPPFVSSRNT